MSDNTSSNGDGPSTDSEYLFIVDYEDDAERKRVEYLFNNWDDGEITKPSGLVRIGRSVSHDELYEDLVAKVPADQVQSYRLEPVDTDVTPETLTVDQSINAPKDAVETFVEYIFSKKKAVLQSAPHNEYEVYTKKGRAEATYQLDTDDETTTVIITVTGHSPAPEFLAEFFETELEAYANSQS